MPASTPIGLPYPLPTEPVAEGAQAIRNLAEAVDAELAWSDFAGVGLFATGANPGVSAKAARWIRAGRLVVYRGRFTLSSAGSGDYEINVPTPPLTSGVANSLVGHVRGYNSGSNALTALLPLYVYSATGLRVSYGAAYPFGAFTALGAGAPWAWASGFLLEFLAIYEAAAAA